MSQETLPEIQVATQALESRIMITEGEVENMKEEIVGKRTLLRSLRKALATSTPDVPPRKSAQESASLRIPRRQDETHPIRNHPGS
jgi:hypothetical protein